MKTKTYPLIKLVPYLGKYRYKIALGFLMVVLTVIAAMFSPWVLKYVVDDLRHGFIQEKLFRTLP